MNLFLLALLPFVSQAAQPKCYTGTVTVGESVWTKDQVLAQAGPMVFASFKGVAANTPHLQEFLKKQGSCQQDCLVPMMQQTISTLYGKTGKDFLSEEKVPIFVEAITGAFSACYPASDRAETKAIATAIISSTFSIIHGTTCTTEAGQCTTTQCMCPSGYRKKEYYDDAGYKCWACDLGGSTYDDDGHACANAGHEDDFPLNSFLKQFKETFMTEVKNDRGLAKFFQTEAKDCQMACTDITVPLAVQTLFLTANKDDDEGVDAVTGAIHACFPGVSLESIHAVVAASKDAVDVAQAKAAARLYSIDIPQSASGTLFGFWSLYSLSLFAGVSLVMFAAGMAVGKRWQRHSGVRQDDMGNVDEQGLIE